MNQKSIYSHISILETHERAWRRTEHGRLVRVYCSILRDISLALGTATMIFGKIPRLTTAYGMAKKKRILNTIILVDFFIYSG
jgi:hypothetical protein